MAVVTLDLFSALTDSRSGASAALGSMAAARGWPQTGEELYDRWDAANKALQRSAAPGATFTDCSLRALEGAYEALCLPVGRAPADLEALHASLPDWPLWPDVEEGVRRLAAHHRVGILSNVDDHLVVRTRAYRLVDPGLVLSSQRLGALKPSAAIYRSAAAAVAPERLVHVAASGRDVRGALEAGVVTVRLVRPGHVVDRDGPAPPVEVTDAADLPDAVGRALATS